MRIPILQITYKVVGDETVFGSGIYKYSIMYKDSNPTDGHEKNKWYICDSCIDTIDECFRRISHYKLRGKTEVHLNRNVNYD